LSAVAARMAVRPSPNAAISFLMRSIVFGSHFGL